MMNRNCAEPDDLMAKASEFVESCKLQTLLDPFRYYTTGSYALDVIAWPDIDINVLYGEAQRSEIFTFGSYIVRSLTPSWFELRETEQEEMSPGHFFLGFERPYKDLLWNVDVWFLSKSEYDENIAWLEKTRKRLGVAEKESIVTIKQYLIEKGTYPGGCSSIAVYEAVLDHGISEPTGFESWYTELKGVEPSAM